MERQGKLRLLFPAFAVAALIVLAGMEKVARGDGVTDGMADGMVGAAIDILRQRGSGSDGEDSPNRGLPSPPSEERDSSPVRSRARENLLSEDPNGNRLAPREIVPTDTKEALVESPPKHFSSLGESPTGSVVESPTSASRLSPATEALNVERNLDPLPRTRISRNVENPAPLAKEVRIDSIVPRTTDSGRQVVFGRRGGSLPPEVIPVASLKTAVLPNQDGARETEGPERFRLLRAGTKRMGELSGERAQGISQEPPFENQLSNMPDPRLIYLPNLSAGRPGTDINSLKPDNAKKMGISTLLDRLDSFADLLKRPRPGSPGMAHAHSTPQLSQERREPAPPTTSTPGRFRWPKLWVSRLFQLSKKALLGESPPSSHRLWFGAAIVLQGFGSFFFGVVLTFHRLRCRRKIDSGEPKIELSGS